MVCSDKEAKKPNAHHGIDYTQSPEDGFLAKSRNRLAHCAKGRNGKNINFGVPEESKQMLK